MRPRKFPTGAYHRYRLYAPKETIFVVHTFFETQEILKLPLVLSPVYNYEKNLSTESLMLFLTRHSLPVCQYFPSPKLLRNKQKIMYAFVGFRTVTHIEDKCSHLFAMKC